MSEKNKNCILIVEKDLKNIVSLSQKCIEAGVDENCIFATISTSDISRFLNTKNISTVIIDSELYNLKSASVIKNFALNENLETILVKSEFTKKTIRMMMDKNLKYISLNMKSNDLSRVLASDDKIVEKKVVHL